MVMLSTLVATSVIEFGDSHLFDTFGQALDKGLDERQGGCCYLRILRINW